MLIRNNKKKILLLTTLVFIILLINIFLFVRSPTIITNIAQEIKILSCQPFFPEGYGEKAIFKMNSQKKIKSILYGFINFIKNGCNAETLIIDISFKNLQIIKNDRDRAIKNSININPKKVPVNLTWKNKTYKASARLKGDLPTHWTSTQQWSLKFVLKKDQSIEGFREFSITKPYERRFPTNQVIGKSLQRANIISPKFLKMKIKINGIDWGLMLAEEQFSNAYLELRNLKDSPVIKLTNQEDFMIKQFLISNKSYLKKNLDEDIISLLYRWRGKFEIEVYNKKNYIDDPKYLDLISFAKSLKEGIINNELTTKELEKFVDIPKFASTVASSFLWGDVHSLLDDNSRFYLNPYTAKLEPIPTDHLYNQVAYNGIAQPLINAIKSDKEGIAIYYKIFKSKYFQEEYIKALENIDDSFLDIEKDFKDICNPYGKRCLNNINLIELKNNLRFLLILDKKIFKDLITKIKKKNDFKNIVTNSRLKKSFKKISFLNKNIYARAFSDGEIVLYNLTPFKLRIKKIIVGDINLKTNIILEPSNFNSVSKKNFYLSKKITIGKKLTLHTDLLRKKRTLEIKVENSNFRMSSLLKGEVKFPHFIKLKEKTYIIDSGEWTINEPIVLPEGYSLELKPNTKLTFKKNSYIYINGGNLSSIGTLKKPIILKPEKKIWGGIFVSQSKNKKSQIIYNKIIGTNFFKHGAINLTGGINFFLSNVEIENTDIINSKAEDAINLIQSNFLIKNSNFIGHESDAIDSDFSKGVIENVFFNNVKNDALDTSGSKVSVINSNFINVSDKAISAGENSVLTLENLNIDNAKIGIASKDGSIVNGNKIGIANSLLYDIAAYQKKSFYKGGKITIKNLEVNKMKTLIQKNSTAFINNEKIPTIKFKTKEKLY